MTLKLFEAMSQIVLAVAFVAIFLVTFTYYQNLKKKHVRFDQETKAVFRDYPNFK